MRKGGTVGALFGYDYGTKLRSLATTTAVRDCRIQSWIGLSFAYVQIAFEYRKPAPAGTADITFSEAWAYPTSQSEVGERDIVCILQLAGARANNNVRKHKEELALVAKTEMCILRKDERISLPSILAFIPAGEWITEAFVDSTISRVKTRSSGAKIFYVNESWLGTSKMLAPVAYCNMAPTYYAGSRRTQASERVYSSSTRSPRATSIGILNRIVNFLIHFFILGVFFRLS